MGPWPADVAKCDDAGEGMDELRDRLFIDFINGLDMLCPVSLPCTEMAADESIEAMRVCPVEICESFFLNILPNIFFAEF